MREYRTTHLEAHLGCDRHNGDEYRMEIYAMVKQLYADWRIQKQDKITLDIWIRFADHNEEHILLPTQKADRFMRELFFNISYPFRKWVKPHLHLKDRIVDWNWQVERYGFKRHHDNEEEKEDENKRARF